jgi:molybdopterin adenylyltransferase
MLSKGEVISVNISEEKGELKYSVKSIELDKNGVVGDAHAGPWNRQVSLLNFESIERFNAENKIKIKPGEFAENITLGGIDLTKVKILDRLKIDDVLLEVTQIGKKCHGDKCHIYQAVGKCVMPKEGIFCRVIRGGRIKVGSEIEYSKRKLKVFIVTLSDRAFAGEYEDRSGPQALQLIDEFLQEHAWDREIEPVLLSDDTDKLEKKLKQAIEQKFDLIFTLGGTGIGARDITPEVVLPLCEKIIPGIMENIRIKYGATIPSALLSRSIAGISGQSQIYTLPGSVKAVKEYLSELFNTIEHAVYMLHGIGH